MSSTFSLPNSKHPAWKACQPVYARHVLEQAGINLKGLNVDKLKAEYQELMKQKNELTSTYKDCEKEVRELKRKQENLNQYLGRTQPNPAQEQPEKNKNKSLWIVKSTIIFQVALFTFNSKSLIHYITHIY